MALLTPQQFATPKRVPILIRSAVESDAPAILAFRARGASSAPFLLTVPEEVPARVEDQAASIAEFASSPTAILAVAEAVGEAPHGPQTSRFNANGDALVGIMGLKSPGRRKLNHVVDFGISVEKAWHGQGIGRLMMEAALAFARAHPDIERVTLAVVPENARALRMYERAGFIVEGVQKRHFRQPDGTYHDNVLMGMFVK